MTSLSLLNICLVILVTISVTSCNMCIILDSGDYNCVVKHPGHDEHNVHLAIDLFNFTYVSEKKSEKCNVSGVYRGTSNGLDMTGNDIGCIIGERDLPNVLFNCKFDSQCNGFFCESEENPKGKTVMECYITFPDQNDFTLSYNPPKAFYHFESSDGTSLYCFFYFLLVVVFVL